MFFHGRALALIFFFLVTYGRGETLTFGWRSPHLVPFIYLHLYTADDCTRFMDAGMANYCLCFLLRLTVLSMSTIYCQGGFPNLYSLRRRDHFTFGKRHMSYNVSRVSDVDEP